jgi:hypothetical protein
LWGQIYKKIRLNPIAGGSFFVLEYFWGVEVGDWRTLPVWEKLFVFADDVEDSLHSIDAYYRTAA